jgi:hypothetical protein
VPPEALGVPPKDGFVLPPLDAFPPVGEVLPPLGVFGVPPELDAGEPPLAAGAPPVTLAVDPPVGGAGAVPPTPGARPSPSCSSTTACAQAPLNTRIEQTPEMLLAVRETNERRSMCDQRYLSLRDHAFQPYLPAGR